MASILDRRILLIDDYEQMLDIAALFLKEAGLEHVFTAHSGKEGMLILAKEKIDLVLCDWLMPEMDGLQFYQAMRKHKVLKEIPFAMVTSKKKKEDVQTAQQAGVNNYIIKPFTSEVFVSRVKSILVE